MAICHPVDLLTGLILYKGLYIHLSVWIYKWVGRYHGDSWPGRHVYIDLYMWLPADPSTYFSSRMYIQGLSLILACINIDLYGYTDRLTRIRSAGWQLDMHMFIYINGYVPICQHICHPEIHTYIIYIDVYLH